MATKLQTWLIIGGLKDFIHPPHANHSIKELPAIIEGWKSTRSAEWVKQSSENILFGIGWSQGMVTFFGEGMQKNPPVEGFILWGSTSFENDFRADLGLLATLISTAFGQYYVEIHYAGRIYSGTRDMTGTSS